MADYGERSTITWLYYRELPRVMRFYEEVMAFMFRDPEGYVVEIQQSLPGALSI
jgi:predicted enzyme related to lactoylglutathione lyase